MRREKKCGVVAGRFFADLLVFLVGVLEKAGVWCGVLLVSLWWIDGGSMVFRRVFLSAKKYANFFGFIFGGMILKNPGIAGDSIDPDEPVCLRASATQR